MAGDALVTAQVTSARSSLTQGKYAVGVANSLAETWRSGLA